MSGIAFSKAQADHALGVVLKLMKERRFFLYQHDPRSHEDDPGFTLDSKVFGPALQLDQELLTAYEIVTLNSVSSVLRIEEELGIVRPDLSGNKQIVQCNRYTGGLDICRVLPLTAFARYASKRVSEVREHCLKAILGKNSEDDISPKELRQHHDFATSVSEKILAEFHAIKIWDPNNTSCVVLMKTRFHCDSPTKGDFMQGRTADMQKAPHALGYLFYRHSMASRIVPHDYVVFSTAWSSHVNVHHFKGEKVAIRFDMHGGYSCRVFFATIL